MTAIVDQESPEATLGADESTSLKKTQLATDRTQVSHSYFIPEFLFRSYPSPTPTRLSVLQNANPISLSFSNINYSITTYDKKSKVSHDDFRGRTWSIANVAINNSGDHHEVNPEEYFRSSSRWLPCCHHGADRIW
jgi:hypothetical protein